MAFHVASLYGGEKVEPKGYTQHSIEIIPDVERVMRSSIKEGCFAETFSALECAKTTLKETNPILRSMWNQVMPAR